MNLISKRRIWYAISLIIIIPGLIALLAGGLKLGIDFSGGSESEVEGQLNNTKINELANSSGLKDVTIISTNSNRELIRYRVPNNNNVEAKHQEFKTKLASSNINEIRFDTIGPSVSKDITRNALISIILASIAIVLYIAFAFRNVPPPASSWNFGIAAIIALLHDALLLIGIFAILGRFLGIEIDSLFVTAVLTVIGFSVHDTIVVFDRIRENLRHNKGDFEILVNNSILETLARSVNTSLTVILTLCALLLFGGESIRLFILALLIGIISGTYSSIFNASCLLVTWQQHKTKLATKKV